MAIERTEVPVSDRWNVEAMYPSLQEWEKEFSQSFVAQKPHWPELGQYQGRLVNPAALKAAMTLLFNLDQKLSRLYTYAHLRHDEELTDDLHKSAFQRISALLHDFQQETAWFQPELLTLSESQIDIILKSSELEPYKFYLQRIFRLKPHVLPPEQEELMALAGQTMQAPHKVFSAINDADFKFGTIVDGKGETRELTHSLYGLYIRDHDRELRKNAVIHIHKRYEEYQNTLCELLQGQVQAHLFNAKARKYPSCLEAALFPNNIDPSVYHSLIKAVHDEIHVLHKYIALRQLALPGIDQLHVYDLYVPLTPQFDMRIPYAEAEELIIESVACLGPEYQNILREGLKHQRWVDRYENKNKRSGAYSSGSYDSLPYILMNYQEMVRDLFTLAHEAGHSMHSYLSHKNQPYHYGDYSIFVAEVASTFNEELLMQLLLQRAKTKEEKIFLINQKIEDIRATLFRQTLFAEFELLLHQFAEQQVPLTPKLLREEYLKLNKKYYSELVVFDPEIEVEWSRIPHFYYNFYVFQYATGISAALALADRVTKGGVKERDDYLAFLKGGSSHFPMDMLKIAGIDMRSPEPVKAAIGKFSKLVDQLWELLK